MGALDVWWGGNVLEKNISVDKTVNCECLRSQLKQCLEDDKDFFTKLLDNPESVDWFKLDTKMSEDFAKQIHDLIKKNNQNPEKKSMIERSVDALMESKHKPYIFTYQWQVMWFIMLWRQDVEDSFMGETIYQRWSLIVDWVNGLWVAKQLIRIANENAFEYVTKVNDDGTTFEERVWLKVYGIASGEHVINYNLESGQKILIMKLIEKKYPKLFWYLQSVRGWDFRNLHDDEKALSQTFIFNNSFLELLQNLMLNQSSIAAIDAQTVESP